MFNDNIRLAANLLNRCPSCMNNLARHICEFTCSPVQSNFINVLKIGKNPKNNRSYVDEIDVHITEQYLVGTYNSCKNVQFPSSGQLALDLMCGDYGAARCSPMNWFSFMGNAEGSPFVPFQINYRPHNSTANVDSFTPVNPRVVPCNESIDVRMTHCLINISLTHQLQCASFFHHDRVSPQRALALTVPHRVQSPHRPSLFHNGSSSGASTDMPSLCSSFSSWAVRCLYWALGVARAAKTVSLSLIIQLWSIGIQSNASSAFSELRSSISETIYDFAENISSRD